MDKKEGGMTSEYQHTTSAQRVVRAALLRQAIRGVTFPGGYRVLLYTTDGGVLCRDCCRSEARHIMSAAPGDGWEPMAVDVYWEGPDDTCGHCGASLPSEYGDPDAGDCPEAADGFSGQEQTPREDGAVRVDAKG